jgi:peptide/nickel transport system substrate-binding protein
MAFCHFLVVASMMVVSVTAAVSTQAADEAALRVAVKFEPDSIDATQSSNPPQSWVALNNVYDKLVMNAPDGRLVPALALSWDIAAEGKTITMHLRHGVRFHSGDLFTAADVVFSHLRTLARARFYGGYARFIERVEAIDDYTVRFVFKRPDALFLPIHPLIIVSKAYFDRAGEAEFASHPTGTGPYRIVGYRPAQYIDFGAWDGYWGDQPAVKRARFQFVKDDETRVAMLRAGEVDAIMDTPYAAYDDLKLAGFTLVKVAVHPTQSLQFQLLNPQTPWHDRRIRQAIAYAIDTKAIVNGLFHGVPYRYPRLMPGELGFDPNLMDYAYDPAKARRLAEEAGYGNGWSMPLFFETGTYFGAQQTAEAVALYLKKNLNVTTELQGLDLLNLLQRADKIANDPNARYVGISGFPVANLSDPIQGIILALYGKSRFSSYHNPEFDAMFEQADMMIDDSKRAPLIRKLMEIEQQDLPTITLWQYASVYALKHDLGYTPTLHGLEVLYLPRIQLRKAGRT